MPMPDGTGKGLRAMTMKEKLEIHRQIEAENERKLKAFLQWQAEMEEPIGLWPIMDYEPQTMQARPPFNYAKKFRRQTGKSLSKWKE